MITEEPIKNNIEIFELHGKILHITGHVIFDAPFSVYYKTGDGSLTELQTYARYDVSKEFDDNSEKKGYTFEVDAERIDSLQFCIEHDGEFSLLTNNTCKHSRLSNIKYHYYYENGILIKHAEKRTRISIIKGLPKSKIIAHELRYLKHLCLKKKKPEIAMIRLRHMRGATDARRIWLFSDREFMGGDSGETLFRYAQEQPEAKDNDFYFVVGKNYPDFDRMSKYGKVCSYHSSEFKMLVLKAQFLISSHADNYVTNPFGKDKKYLADLFRFRYIYLTHGILLHDSSNWLNRINKNFTLNVVTSPMEYESIINGPYYFTDSQLIKTGMPRYDNYYDAERNESKTILFMPSWRTNLAANVIPGTQRREYNPDFTKSEYYRFYESLLTNERLITCLRENGFKIRFCIHPSFRNQVDDFKLLESDTVHFETDANSQQATLSSKLLVTDYSSAACDFAYLGKPVVYANFDQGHIYQIHYYGRGYFDYDRDGFGPNCKSEDEVINAIIGYISNDFEVEKKYADRMDKFFYHRDNKNSERVFNEILKLQEKLESGKEIP